jgi:ATP-binding cassette subfamily F protein uup
VRLHNVGARFGALRVLSGVTYEFKPRERVGIVGPNGSGKTTLLRLIAERREPDDGSVRTGTTVFRGWFGQEPEPLPARTRVVDAVKEVVLETNTVDGITLSATQLLERFMFDKFVQGALVSELSGGERRRLELLRVLATAPNLLLLDEPTNDLDLDTLAVLEEYLEQWPGTMVVASHDRFFLDRVCTSLFSIEPDGSVRHHPGGWTAYRQWEADRGTREAASARVTPPAGASSPAGAGGAGTLDGRASSTAASRRSGAKPPKLGYNERRELGQLERRIEKLERRKAELTRAVQESGSDYAAALEAGNALSATTTELEQAESRWLELQVMTE